MKKKYINPKTYNFKLVIACQLLKGTVTNVDDDDDIGSGGGGNGDANVKEREILEEIIWQEETESQKKNSLW